MTHEAARERILDLVYGELPPREEAEVQAHLAGCAACRSERDAIEATRAVLRALDPAPAPARGEAALLAAARRAAEERRGARRPLLSPWVWKLALGTAAVAAVGTVSFRLLSLRERAGEPAELLAPPQPRERPPGPAVASREVAREEPAPREPPPRAEPPQRAPAGPGERAPRVAAAERAEGRLEERARGRAAPGKGEAPAGGRIGVASGPAAAPEAASAAPAAPPGARPAEEAARAEAPGPARAAEGEAKRRAFAAAPAAPEGAEDRLRKETTAAPELVREVERLRGAGRLSESARAFEPCAPGADVARRLWRDARGRPRKLERETYGPEARISYELYYDAEGRLRFATVRVAAANGTVAERRIWLDAAGARAAERERVLAGPGYPLPAAWPEEDLARDPLAAFAAPARCPEVGDGGSR